MFLFYHRLGEHKGRKNLGTEASTTIGSSTQATCGYDFWPCYHFMLSFCYLSDYNPLWDHTHRSVLSIEPLMCGPAACDAQSLLSK